MTTTHTCHTCLEPFSIDDASIAFYAKVSPVIGGKTYDIPLPTLCPECRAARRLSFRNERSLHHRTCDKTGTSIISFYPPQSPYKVYEHDAWWGDDWDSLSYGRDVDFSRPFFEQFAELQRQVPRIAMVTTQLENCLFSPYSVQCKRCYLCISCVVGEDLYYCYQTNASRNCVDCSLCTRCELCYDCVHCAGLYSSVFCKNCDNGTDLFFCEDCRGCTNCIGCKNLSNKKNYILNAPASQEEVTALRLSLEKHTAREEWMKKAITFFSTLPTRSSHMTNCEQCTGDFLRDCRDCRECFDVVGLEGCAYLFPGPKRDVLCEDCNYTIESELIYDSVSAVDGYDCKWILHSWNMKHAMYTDECFGSDHLFGCIGLKKKSYCILNKQYGKEEYESLVSRLIHHMKKTGEWGEFLPISLSPFAYNESVAYEHSPLTAEAATTRGYRWSTYEAPKPDVKKIITASSLPQDISQIPDDVLNWTITCEVSGKPFRIIKQELDFYRSQRIPLPRKHPEQRYKERTIRRNPRKLTDRQCSKCGVAIKTTSVAEKQENVYCEACFVDAIE